MGKKSNQSELPNTMGKKGSLLSTPTSSNQGNSSSSTSLDEPALDDEVDIGHDELDDSVFKTAKLQICQDIEEINQYAKNFKEDRDKLYNDLEKLRSEEIPVVNSVRSKLNKEYDELKDMRKIFKMDIEKYKNEIKTMKTEIESLKHTRNELVEEMESTKISFDNYIKFWTEKKDSLKTDLLQIPKDIKTLQDKHHGLKQELESNQDFLITFMSITYRRGMS